MGFNVLDPKNVEKFFKAVNNDREFQNAARHASLNLMLGIGLGYQNKKILVQIHGGQVIKFEVPTDVHNALSEVEINGTEEFWENFLKPIQPPYFTTIYSAMMIGHVVLAGSIELFWANMWVILRLFDILRNVQNDITSMDLPKTKYEIGYCEPQTGKYVYVEVEGIKYRVYYEESGQGIPLVCQHTAGSDGQQYRYVLTDPDVTSKYRVIAFDLPYHGKSQPPEGVKWWEQEYKLRKKWLVEFHVAFNKALGLPKGAFLGCSMGGHLALDLALDVPDLYRACVGIAGGLGNPGLSGPSYLTHPRVNGLVAGPVLMHSLCGPDSPLQQKWEVVWGYMQGAPGICQGDEHYYNHDHNLRETAHLIDTKRCATYLLNGEYDFSASFREGEEVIAMNPGIKYIPMKGLGHFGVTEDYLNMKKYLHPVLDEVTGLFL